MNIRTIGYGSVAVITPCSIICEAVRNYDLTLRELIDNDDIEYVSKALQTATFHIADRILDSPYEEQAKQVVKTLFKITIRITQKMAQMTRKGYAKSGFTTERKSMISRKLREREDERRIAVISIDAKTKEITEYPSVSEASRVTGIAAANISKVINGKRKYAGGRQWYKSKLTIDEVQEQNTTETEGMDMPEA